MKLNNRKTRINIYQKSVNVKLTFHMKKIIFIVSFFLCSNLSFAQTFSDVDPGNWAYTYIEDLVARGIVDDGYFFHPDDYLTRAELVKIMVLATTGIIDDRLPESPSFSDSDSTEWYYPYLETAKITGLIDGYPDGTFRPSKRVIRAEAMKIVVNALGIAKSYDSKIKFRDYDNQSWFNIYVVSAYEEGIISGLVNDKGREQMIFKPSDSITRAQMAKIISKAISVSELY